MKKKDLSAFGIALTCGLFILLSACADNKSQETQPTPKVVGQTASTPEVGSQSPSPATPPGAELSSAAADGGKCGSLLTAKCTECHNLTRICEKLGKKSASRWQRTISRMTERGAKVNAEEAAGILLCLDSGAKNLEPICR